MYNCFVKRMLDIIISLVALLILLPVFLLFGLAIKLNSKGPILFKQKRIGRNLKPFFIYKFRTMINNAENIGTGILTLENDFRITRIGRFLRKTSLDELPQLINILKGDMSLIGPRPTVENKLTEMGDYVTLRHSVRPGVTGLAQVNGRQSLTWLQKAEYDSIYAKNVSFLLDLKIIFKTVYIVFKSEDVYKREDDRNR